MGASDYITVKGPQTPQDYAAPLAGIAFGQQLANLPDAYFQGTQQKRTRELQKPILDENGEPSTDVNKVTKELMRRGGAEYSKELIPFLQKQPFYNELLRQQQDNGGFGSAAPPPQTQGWTGYVPGPGMKGGATAINPPGQQARISSNGSDIGAGPGEDTLRSVATEFVGGDTDATPQISMAARALRIDPDAPLTPEKAKLVKDFLGTARTASLGNQETQPPGQPSSAAERASNGPGGNAAAPVMAGGASGAPAPQTGPAPGTRVAQAADQSPLKGLIPDQYLDRPDAWVQGLRRRAEGIRKQAQIMGVVGIPSKSNEDQAAALDKQADTIEGFIGKAGERTGPMKEARDPLTQSEKTREKVAEGDIKVSEKAYSGLQTLGQTGQIGNQKLDRIRALISDPNFFSGAGHEIAQKWNQWTVSLGGNPSKAQPMEEFNKTAQQLLTDDIKAMGASGAGPVRVAEVQIMKQATANLGISPATNRYLVEEAYRVHKDNIEVARLAQQYKTQKGYLDAGWDAVRDKYYQDHPLFSKQELEDPRLVAPPYLPKDVAADPAKHAAWVRAQGIKPGDPIKTDDPKRPIVYAR